MGRHFHSPLGGDILDYSKHQSKERGTEVSTASSNGVSGSNYMWRRWTKSRVTQADYRATRQVLLEELAPARQDRVLEIGCGPGTWTHEVAPLVACVVAVEMSESRSKEARSYTAGMPVEVIHGDFMQAPLTGEFTKVFSARAIEYILDVEGMAAKIAGLLAPGGTVVLITKTRFSIWRGRMRLLERRLHKRPASELGMGAQRLLSPGQLIRAFAPHGVRPLRVRPVVLRPPLFKGGFHELPVIPDSVAGPVLAVSDAVFRMTSHPPMALAAVPLALTESYAITFRKQGAPEDAPA